MKLKNRVAIITGAARGIGKAVALTFARKQGSVVLVDVDTGRLEILKNEIQEKGGVVVAVSADITNSSEMKRMVAKVHKTLGRIDILVNNAGIIRRGTIETITEED